MAVHRHVTPCRLRRDQARRGRAPARPRMGASPCLRPGRRRDQPGRRLVVRLPALPPTKRGAWRSTTSRSAVPAQARWPDGLDPITHWRRTYGRLVAVTRERDSPNRWHNMSTEIVMDPQAKQQLGVPEARRVARATSPARRRSASILRRPLVEGRYAAQTVEPLGPAARADRIHFARNPGRRAGSAAGRLRVQAQSRVPSPSERCAAQPEVALQLRRVAPADWSP